MRPPRRAQIVGVCALALAGLVSALAAQPAQPKRPAPAPPPPAAPTPSPPAAPTPSPATCAPQDVAGDGDCDLALGVYWDGQGCGSIGGCSCVGKDCAAGFADEEQCLAAHATCPGVDPPRVRACQTGRELHRRRDRKRCRAVKTRRGARPICYADVAAACACECNAGETCKLGGADRRELRCVPAPARTR